MRKNILNKLLSQKISKWCADKGALLEVRGVAVHVCLHHSVVEDVQEDGESLPTRVVCQPTSSRAAREGRRVRVVQVILMRRCAGR